MGMTVVVLGGCAPLPAESLQRPAHRERPAAAPITAQEAHVLDAFATSRLVDELAR